MTTFSRFISSSIAGGTFVQPIALAFHQQLVALRKFHQPLVHRPHEAKRERRQNADQQK